MAAQKGSALLIKIGSGSPESFTTVGGLRSTSISLNDEAVDVTTMDSSNNRTLLPNGGIQSMSISGSGVFTDAASETALKTAFGASTFSNYQFIVPMDNGETGTYEGAFMISSLEYSGEYNGEVTYSVTLESSGAVTYTVA